jgi:hypothetical protein
MVIPHRIIIGINDIPVCPLFPIVIIHSSFDISYSLDSPLWSLSTLIPRSSSQQDTVQLLTSRDDFSAGFAMMYGLLVFLKCFHWITADRVDYVRLPYHTLSLSYSSVHQSSSPPPHSLYSPASSNHTSSLCR